MLSTSAEKPKPKSTMKKSNKSKKINKVPASIKAEYIDGDNKIVFQFDSAATLTLTTPGGMQWVFEQKDWNLNKLYGKIDFTKSQVLMVDYSGAPSCRIRFGFFDRDSNNLEYVHEFKIPFGFIHDDVFLTVCPITELLQEEIAKLKLEVERLNSESIEQMGIAQDTEAELQAVSKEFETYKDIADGIIEKITDRCHEQACHAIDLREKVIALRIENERLKTALKATASAIV